METHVIVWLCDYNQTATTIWSEVYLIDYHWLSKAITQAVLLSGRQQEWGKVCWSFKGWFTFKIQGGLAQRKNTAGGHNAVSGIWAWASCSSYSPSSLSFFLFVCVCVWGPACMCSFNVQNAHTSDYPRGYCSLLTLLPSLPRLLRWLINFAE